MKPLSLRQAQRCENAKHGRCRCRCGGVLHGAMRNVIEEGREADPAFYEALPEEDPHKATRPAARKPRRKERALPLFEEL